MDSQYIYKNVLAQDGVALNANQGGSSRMVSSPLVRQSSVYSLTLDEFQNGIGKDFGSMNMDEFLKNIWCAEEYQCAPTPSAFQEVNSSGLAREFSLPRQGSLTLPRTLSLKTVDEVYKDIFKETVVETVTYENPSSALHAKQPALGEMTLEEFLVRAGVVREESQQDVTLNGNMFGGNYGSNKTSNSGDELGLALRFGQPDSVNGDLLSSRSVIDQSSNLVDLEAIKTHVQQPPPISWLNNQYNRASISQPPLKQQEILPKQPVVNFGSSVQFGGAMDLMNSTVGNTSLSQVSARNGNVLQSGPAGLVGGVADAITATTVSTVSPTGNGLLRSSLPGALGIGVAGLGAGKVAVSTASPLNHPSDATTKSNGDNSSISPVPYTFTGGMRGRKLGGTVEKVVERRQRRMIKNRESAARSRARKQAYTMELEAEVAKLKEENLQLHKKQAEIVEIQKAQVPEKMNHPVGNKRVCLRRTLTGPW